MENNIETNSVSQREEELSAKRISRYKFLRKILIGFIIISFINLFLSYGIPTPKMYSISKQNRELIIAYEVLSDRIAAMEGKLSDIRHRDQYVYRSLFAVDTFNFAGNFSPYKESKYSSFQGDDYAYLMTKTWKQMDVMTKRLYAQSVSLDELQILAKNKESMSQAIPAIWPIDRTKLEAFYGYGTRRDHPIYHVRKMHRGVDMACDKGGKVYATGDATVELVDIGLRRRGYGHLIVLNHEFGYKTKYAHLGKMYVKSGDHVKRGQIIAEVGSTGGSTGPHLHYEVLFNGRNVNPINYFNKNMSNEEYKALIESARYNTNLESD
ncbi:MAG: M23 family metallopeptidase [Alistipes sp.]|nr:M23 family metallopeptidase [Candidatus Alistipes equi]